MKCPICEDGDLDSQDDELVCMDCGAAFILDYVGMYEEGSDERIDQGFEPKEWLKKYHNKTKYTF